MSRDEVTPEVRICPADDNAYCLIGAGRAGNKLIALICDAHGGHVSQVDMSDWVEWSILTKFVRWDNFAE